MKQVFTTIFLAVTLLFLSSLKFAEEIESCGEAGRKSSGPPSCCAGEPPNNTTCAKSGCHDGIPLNSGAAELFFSLGDTLSNYIPGKTYTVTVGITRKDMERGGFQIIALQDNKPSLTPGVVTITNQARTQRIDAANPHSGGCAIQQKVWVEHAYDGIDDVVNDTLQWQYTWQAPDSNVGGITFYLAALDSDFDLDNSNDTVYALKKTFTVADVSSAVSNLSMPDVKVSPNPFSNSIHIETDKAVEYELADVTGKVVAKGFTNEVKTEIPTAHIAKGTYLLSLGNQQNRAVKKLVKRH